MNFKDARIISERVAPNGTLFLIPDHILCPTCQDKMPVIFIAICEKIRCKNGHLHDAIDFDKQFGIIKGVNEGGPNNPS